MTTAEIGRLQSRPTTIRTTTRVATVASSVLGRVRTVSTDVRSYGPSENEQDLKVLKAARERYAGTNWRETFKPLD